MFTGVQSAPPWSTDWACRSPAAKAIAESPPHRRRLIKAQVTAANRVFIERVFMGWIGVAQFIQFMPSEEDLWLDRSVVSVLAFRRHDIFDNRRSAIGREGQPVLQVITVLNDDGQLVTSCLQPYLSSRGQRRLQHQESRRRSIDLFRRWAWRTCPISYRADPSRGLDWKRG